MPCPVAARRIGRSGVPPSLPARPRSDSTFRNRPLGGESHDPQVGALPVVPPVQADDAGQPPVPDPDGTGSLQAVRSGALDAKRPHSAYAEARGIGVGDELLESAGGQVGTDLVQGPHPLESIQHRMGQGGGRYFVHAGKLRTRPSPG